MPTVVTRGGKVKRFNYTKAGKKAAAAAANESAKLERCVKQVRRKKGVDSAWAICKSSIEEDIVTAGLAGAAGYAGQELAKAAYGKYKTRVARKKKVVANAANESIYTRLEDLLLEKKKKKGGSGWQGKV